MLGIFFKIICSCPKAFINCLAFRHSSHYRSSQWNKLKSINTCERRGESDQCQFQSQSQQDSICTSAHLINELCPCEWWPHGLNADDCVIEAVCFRDQRSETGTRGAACGVMRQVSCVFEVKNRGQRCGMVITLRHSSESASSSPVGGKNISAANDLKSKTTAPCAVAELNVCVDEDRRNFAFIHVGINGAS